MDSESNPNAQSLDIRLHTYRSNYFFLSQDYLKMDQQQQHQIRFSKLNMIMLGTRPPNKKTIDQVDYNNFALGCKQLELICTPQQL